MLSALARPRAFASDSHSNETSLATRSCMRNSPAVAEANRSSPNREDRVVEGFGDEWTRFDQQALDAREKEKVFADYFGIFPWEALPKGGGEGADIGCG